MMTVKEVSRLTGVSIRTLHYYDEIGLLHPQKVNDAGYRFYGKAQLKKLQQILLFRQLEFPLKEIKKIMESPGFDAEEALDQQIELLKLRRKHLDNLLELALEIKKNGEMNMDFKAFDTTEIDQYAEEAKARWGETDAYKESAARTKNYTKDDFDRINGEMTEIYRRLGALKDAGTDPSAPECLQAIRDFQSLITNNYYNCTDEMMKGLAEMHAADRRFAKNIDKMAGTESTAEFELEVIRAHFE